MYEYIVIDHGKDGPSANTIESELNKYGQQGWELVGFANDNYGRLISVLKRKSVAAKKPDIFDW
jgi:hypothetical protein